ncbi:hypothetical protein Hdeb2414_s0003g00112931 [Helianthus debilis subsp. tardiflorus]
MRQKVAIKRKKVYGETDEEWEQEVNEGQVVGTFDVVQKLPSSVTHVTNMCYICPTPLLPKNGAAYM